MPGYKSDEKCGCGPCSPSWLQKLANPKLFVFNYMIIITLFHSGVTYVNSALTIIERQFKLSSSTSGAIASVNDIAILCVIIFISYFGYRSHRPRWIALCCISGAIGSFLCALPHYLNKPIDTSDLLTNEERRNPHEILGKFMCSTEDDGNFMARNETSEMCNEETSVNRSVIWVFIGQVFVGIGMGVFPIVVTYVEDAVGKSKVLTYMAFVYIGSLCGAICGFLLNSYANSMYVDFDRLAPEDIPKLPQNDTRWIGAWWFGFVLIGILKIVAAIPMFFFPRVMTCCSQDKDKMNPGATESTNEGYTRVPEKVPETRITDVLQSGESKGLKEVALGLLPSVRRVVGNMTLLFVALSSAATASTSSILLANLPKFLVYQFRASISTASMIFAAMIPLGVVSNFVSAFIVRKLKHNLQKSTILTIVAKLTAALFLFAAMLVKCPTPPIAGYSLSWDSGSSRMSGECHSDCACSDEDFFPVCGEDGITYTTPCFAGCTSFDISRGNNSAKDSMVTYDCACPYSTHEEPRDSFSASPGFCEAESGCHGLIILTLLISATIFIMFLSSQPITYIVLRICEADDRAVALGFLSVVPKLLGFIPAPIYFGALVNTTCQLWKVTCGERGNCWIYDLDSYRYYLFGFIAGFMALSSLFMVFALRTLRSTLRSLENHSEQNSHKMTRL